MGNDQENPYTDEKHDEKYRKKGKGTIPEENLKTEKGTTVRKRNKVIYKVGKVT